MIWQSEGSRYKSRFLGEKDWHRHYCWLPQQTEEGQTVWLGWVWRKALKLEYSHPFDHGGYGGHFIRYEYRLSPP
jgi:hypothetical protein